MSGAILRVVTRLLRPRYIVLGTGAGGSYALVQKYNEFKESLADMPIFGQLFNEGSPFNDVLSSLNVSLSNANQRRKDLTSEMRAKLADKLSSDASSDESNISIDKLALLPPVKSNTADAVNGSPVKTKKKLLTNEDLQQAILKKELEFHKQIETLAKENRSLRSELILRSQGTSEKGRIKKSLIDMYSEVLDELSDLDAAYNAQDKLPRVVVVGDQSAGKTSVLEMIAQARIFPRGSGEMMTRSPVKVTLSEGPYHIACFKDSPREYDLTKESELAALRKDIEMRMKALVSGGKTISSDVISLNVKGPGLQRMVLVDLPGIISTVTTGMQSNTREVIQQMAKHYMGNPNAIILCVQDGSIDAERSNVTNLVSSIDPQGKRTLFVLTKVDLAEGNLYNPNRIKQILEGKLFPMKALGYFAVVTGRGLKDESIESIKEYEEEFFRKSRLFKEGALKLSQMTTANMSKAVSERFWKMVKDSVVQQADTYRALRYNLETEWKNSFAHFREMDRDDLFEKGRNDILDDLITLNGISTATWEKSLREHLWSSLSPHIFSNIIEPTELVEDLGNYQTSVDIKLRNWVERDLPSAAVQAARQTLYSQLDSRLKVASSRPGQDTIFDQLKSAVHSEARKRHAWDAKAEGSLRVIQSNALEEKTVHEKAHWTTAVDFLDKRIRTRLTEVNESIAQLDGPGWFERWTRWKSVTPEQTLCQQAIQEVDTLLMSADKPSFDINQDDLTAVRRNLQAKNLTVDDDTIKQVWQPMVKRLYLERSLFNCMECRKSFYYYQQGFLNPSPSDSHFNSASSHLHQQGSAPPDAGSPQDPHSMMADFSDCRQVVLFHRLIRMIDATSNALRQQIMNDEARRLESNVKKVLSELSTDPIALQKLMTGRRVQLAEDLKRTRHLQEKLEEFIAALNKGE